MKRLQRGFTLNELFAAIVVLGLGCLVAFLIGSLVRFVWQHVW